MDGNPDSDGRPAGVAYLDGKRLRKLLLAGIQNVGRQRTELDRINVFPVPDGDTGTNLTLTLHTVADAVRPLDTRSLEEVADAAAEASVLGARGNSGMLFSHLLLGFAESLGTGDRASTPEVAAAFSDAAKRLEGVLENPREGTIVSVVRDMAAAGAGNGSGPPDDMLQWFRSVQVAAHESLQRTQEQLPALKEAGVVDAGAKGVVEFFEGIGHLVDGRVDDHALEEEVARTSPRTSLYAARESGVGEGEGRYCTQVTIRGDDIPATSDIRAALSELGTSLIVARSGRVAKVHIHADTPKQVIAILSGYGAVESKLIEDTMLAGTASHHTAVITDSAADLPRDWVERHGVTVVPMQVIIGDDVYRDGVDLQVDEMLEIMANPASPLPRTSQPTPAAFRDACAWAMDHGAEEILGVFISAAVSGTFGSASAALKEFDEVPSVVVDSRSGSLGVGLLVIRAIELLEQGLDLESVAAELERVRSQSNVFFTVDTMEHLVRSGRIGRAKGWLGGMLDVKPILSLTQDGSVEPIDKARGREAVVERVLALLDERLVDAGAERYRLGVVHVGAPDVAEDIARRLRSDYDAREVLVGPAAAVLGVHTGPGTWALAYQIEDGGPESTGG